MDLYIIKLGRGNKRKSGNYVKQLGFGCWTETKNIEEQPKSENMPTQNPLKTEMCQLIYYDFSVK